MRQTMERMGVSPEQLDGMMKQIIEQFGTDPENPLLPPDDQPPVG